MAAAPGSRRALAFDFARRSNSGEPAEADRTEKTIARSVTACPCASGKPDRSTAASKEIGDRPAIAAVRPPKR